MYRFSWLDKKQAATNCVNKNGNKCFQYAPTVVLNYEKMMNILKRYKNKPSVDKYNWEVVNNPTNKDDWKKVWEKQS